jgi:hypothetical protein
MRREMKSFDNERLFVNDASCCEPVACEELFPIPTLRVLAQ